MNPSSPQWSPLVRSARAKQLSDAFTPRRFFDELNAAAVIPATLLQCELTGTRNGTRRVSPARLLITRRLRAPGADHAGVLARENVRDRRHVIQIVRDPGRQQPQRHGPERRMQAAALQIDRRQPQVRELPQAVSSELSELVEQARASAPSTRRTARTDRDSRNGIDSPCSISRLTRDLQSVRSP
jgi:hypothetical protein